ncbi:carbohydrate sulfotransferase 5 [Bacillus rossius redtenbacheri]|uniref:carbohydrate sulfotransferase 5 n=1 Tax=Bacillus rossius redtenbacheri TaxID=93214 RepID=UPI002FDCD350
MPELARLLRGAQAAGKRSGEPMSRRYSAYSAALVVSVCLLIVVFSHQLGGAGTALDRSALLDLGRTIQGWSSSEDDGVDGSGRAALIQAVVAEQRLLVAREMAGYRYPEGRYNISARSLADLVPEQGGEPVRNVVITTWRSGSTFLGDVLNSHPANFYHYEPLLDYDIVQVRGGPLGARAVSTMRALLNCNYSALDHYLDYGKDHVWLFTHNTRLWEQCQRHPHICWLPAFLTPFCRLFPFQSMKVVRLRLALVEEMLADPRLKVRVLLLVRDPRGTLQSRKHRDWCPGNPDCMEPARLCADLVADYGAALRLSSKYPDRFKAVRYEDLSVEPYRGVKELFQFFGLDFHPSVQAFLDTHTKVNVGGVSSTYRNSKSAPFHWRQDLTHREVRAIQRVCRPAMGYWGYRRAVNSSHQREFDPLGEFRLA